MSSLEYRIMMMNVFEIHAESYVLFIQGLPEEMKKAAGKWKDVLLTQFPSSKHFMDESNASEVTDMTSYVDGLLSAHVTVFVTGKFILASVFSHLVRYVAEHSVAKT